MVNQIRDLGQRVLELESGFSLSEKAQKREITPENVFDAWNRLLEVSNQFVKLRVRSNFKVPFEESLLQSVDYPSFLGLSLIYHDFNNLSTPLKAYTSLLGERIKMGDAKVISSVLGNEVPFFAYENVRITLTLSAYLSTGDRRFLIPVDTCSFPELLEILVGQKLNCSYNFTGFQSIPSDLYFAADQLVKNAQENLVNGDISATFKQEYSNLVVIVKDNGTGIPEDKLGKIFGVYTDKEDGTGIGLQVVKRIVDLKVGYADVISTVQGKPAFKYETRFGNIQKVGQPLTQGFSGTYFILYFPK